LSYASYMSYKYHGCRHTRAEPARATLFSAWAWPSNALCCGRVDGRSRFGGRGKSEHHKAACRGKTRGGPGRKLRLMESVTENRPPWRARTGVAARVKRRGKSPPPGGQPPGHDKPHAVQGQTETPGRLPGRGGNSGARLGYRSHARRETPSAGEKSRRKMNDHRRCAFSKRGGTEFGLRPEQRGALRETGAPLALCGPN